MDDFGTDYRMYMSCAAVAQWYVSITAYGGLEEWTPYGLFYSI